MNALELANELPSVENHYTEPEDEILISQVATMLRQQHAEIEALKENIKWLEGKCLIVKELDDSQYPFRAILRKAQEK